MVYILFTTYICLSSFIIFKLKRQLTSERQSRRILSSNLASATTNASNVYLFEKIPLSNKKAYILDTCQLLLTPLAASPAIYTVIKDLRVDILEEYIINDSEWLIVSFMTNTSTKIQGWLPKGRTYL